MRLIHRPLIALSCIQSQSQPLLLMPRSIFVPTTLVRFHRIHSNCDHSDTTHLIPFKPTNEFSAKINHATLIKNGSIHNSHVNNYLLSLYVKSSNLIYAHQLFDEMPVRDVRSWTIIISGLSRIGWYDLALDLFTQMINHGITPNQFTFSSVLKCCAGANKLDVGKMILGWILRNGVCLDMILENSVLYLFVKCEAFDYATKVFESISVKDIVSWNIMISAYLKNGDLEKAVGIFWRMPFRNAASWNTVIDGHLQNGHERIAMQLLYQMVKTDAAFTNVTFSIALSLASSLKHVELGKQIHGRLLRVGTYDGFIMNSLIDMYCKCGETEKAVMVFKTLNQSVHDSVSVSSIVSAYIKNDRIEDALKVFTFMVSEHGEVDKFTLTSVLSACADAGLLYLGQLIHTYILKSGHEPDAFVSSSMIDMYGKCGQLQSASKIFKESDNRNVVLWTSIISCYASHGEGMETIRLFEMMVNEGIKSNEVTFVAVLTACSHAGLIDEGCSYFTLMKDVYGIKPEVEHYTCMVDLLGRAGRLNEIKGFIYENNISHTSAVWKAFLSSCHQHNNFEMAKWVCRKLYELEPSAAGPYVLMSKTFASDCRWEEAAKLKGLMKEKGIKKQPGQSWIQ
ncbi:putative tetratricopeptide-like helical domain superfamily [Helianthus debilis subsp. tardiflorus]